MRNAMTAAGAGIALGMLISTVSASTLYSDWMNRSTFDASSNGWAVQSYSKGKGSFGRTPGAVDSNTAFRYPVQIDGSGTVTETNTVTTSSFAPPTSGNYVEFDAAIKINWSSARQAGLVFALSAYGTNSEGETDAMNIEFVTKQINAVDTNGVSYDNLELTSFNDYTSGGDRWFETVESGVNSTDNYHTYGMRLYPNEVDYLVDGNVFAYTNDYVPTGTNLALELNAWAPDSSWPSAEAPLDDNTFWYMDVSWVTVTSGVGTPPSHGAALLAPEPGTAMLGLGGLV
ncbi:MAG TPA: family 16 glycosylhydrolase, partial [Tepidisphaeraceae bacterium]|nr:family 16 glycosylhydrolase [Tepidisphaeraceae bacterium]